MTRALRVVGWTFVLGGAVLLLYVVYLLFYTNFTTSSAQADLRETWEAVVAQPPADPVIADPEEEEPPPEEEPEPEPEPPPPVEIGDAFAVMWFERPGSDERPVQDEPLYIVEGVSLDVLRRGPGRYPTSAAPGQEGNFAVAGHRTTYGAPFFRLDELEPGDEIYVADRQGRQWRYVVRETRIVSPQDVWVVGDDPLGDGYPVLTLTTCHPRFSAAQRLVVFAGLDGEVRG